MNTIDTSTIDGKIAVMQAYKEGKTVQMLYYDDPDRSWCEDASPAWQWGICDYRIMPEPKVIWVNEYGFSSIAYFSEEEAIRAASTRAERVAVRYVESQEQ